MKVIKVSELPPVTPPKHYDMHVKRAVDESIGSTTMKVAFGHFEPNGYVDPHNHEGQEQLYIVRKGTMVVRGDDGQEFVLKKDDALMIYPGEIHITSAGGEETEYICVTGLNLPPAGVDVPSKSWNKK